MAENSAEVANPASTSWVEVILPLKTQCLRKPRHCCAQGRTKDYGVAAHKAEQPRMITLTARRKHRKKFPVHRICQRILGQSLHQHAAKRESCSHNKGHDNPWEPNIPDNIFRFLFPGHCKISFPAVLFTRIFTISSGDTWMAPRVTEMVVTTAIRSRTIRKVHTKHPFPGPFFLDF